LPSVIFSVAPPLSSEIYTLSLHDALPICLRGLRRLRQEIVLRVGVAQGNRIRPQARDRPVQLQQGLQLHHRLLPQLCHHRGRRADRKSTRLNSSHVSISYAVFCLKKKTSK